MRTGFVLASHVFVRDSHESVEVARMDPRYWTRIYGKLRQSALALGHGTIEELLSLSAAAPAQRQARSAPVRRRPARSPRA